MMDNPITWLVLAVLLLLGFGWWAESSEKAEIASFQQRCIAAGETPAKCAILAEIKRSADDASMAAGFAIGMAAGKR
jgi:hypothetical protein